MEFWDLTISMKEYVEIYIRPENVNSWTAFDGNFGGNPH